MGDGLGGWEVWVVVAPWHVMDAHWVEAVWVWGEWAGSWAAGGWRGGWWWDMNRRGEIGWETADWGFFMGGG